MSARPLVIGLGNPDRGDDAIGRLVARRLRGELGVSAEIVEARGEAMEIAALFEGRSFVILVDACVSGATAGTVRRLDLAAAPAPQKGAELSSHGLGLVAGVELSRALGALPARCIAYAIEGASFDHGAGPAPAVQRAADEVVNSIVGVLRCGARE